MLSIFPLFADIVFPELLLAGRLLAWWVILVGLAVELPIVRLLTGFNLKRCIIADLAMNTISALVGVVLIPVLGLGWELGGSRLFGEIGFNSVHWPVTFAFCVVINSVIEQSVLRFRFKSKLGIRGFWWLCVA